MLKNAACITALIVGLSAILGAIPNAISGSASAQTVPSPLLKKNGAVDWWFVFKLNSGKFPLCGGGDPDCLFGGKPYKGKGAHGQQFVFASSAHRELDKGDGCVGDTLEDPVGATFDQVYNGSLNYIVWNDQFYDDPRTAMCGSCGAGTGHSKGMLAWNDDGDGFVLQVTTPSWPGSGNKRSPRDKAGNTLGCIAKPNNVMVSQHFFALKLDKDGIATVLKALKVASVVADPDDRQIFKVSGPPELKKLAVALGERSDATLPFQAKLTSKVQIIAKPAKLHVPPWQLVSALLDGTPLRAATWWNGKKIYTTNSRSKMTCWDKRLNKPGNVEIALSGQWDSTTFGLTGGASPDRNHAKIGVSIDSDSDLSIFGDMNQEGATATSQDCTASQNSRGGLFYVVKDKQLNNTVTELISGDTAPASGPRKTAKK